MKKKKIFVKEFVPGDIVHHPFLGLQNGIVIQKHYNGIGNNRSVHVKAHGRFFTFSPSHLTLIEQYEDRKKRVVESPTIKKVQHTLNDDDVRRIVASLDPSDTQEEFDRKISGFKF
jgi:hypothetical protein